MDDQLRHADDRASIGLLLCKERDHLTVEYALRDLKKPIGVAQWQTKLVESLPKNQVAIVLGNQLLRAGTAVGALGIANRATRTFSAAETALLIEAGRAIAATL